MNTKLNLVPLPVRIKYCGLYVITHVKSGLMYAGSTGDLHTRQYDHENRLHRDNHPNRGLQAAFNDDPRISFTVHITKDRDEAYTVEQEFIDFYLDSGILFNVATDARFPTKGLRYGPVTIEKMKRSSVGRNLGIRKSAETRARMSIARKGVSKSQEHVQAMSVCRVGKSVPMATREKIAQSLKDRVFTAEHFERLRAAALETRVSVSVSGIVYDSVGIAASMLGVHRDTVRNRVLSNNPRFADWKYA